MAQVVNNSPKIVFSKTLKNVEDKPNWKATRGMDKRMNKTTFKSISAILAGFISVFVLSIGTDFVLEALGVFPSPGTGLFIPWMLMLALVYRCAYTVLGGYITATLAPNRPMRHAIILGIIGMIAATLGAIAGWNLSQHWYPIALIITALPCTWLGGKLKK